MIAYLFLRSQLLKGRKTGVTGFAKGVAIGAIGAIVKPVMGVTEGVACVAQGISNQMSDVAVITACRPPRAFHRSPVDISELILVPLNILEAKTQAYASMLALKEGKKDAYVGCAVVSEPEPATAKKPVKGQIIFLTDRFASLGHVDSNYNITGVDWRLPYGDISHCTLQLNFLCVEFVVYKSSSGGGSGGGVLSPMSPLSAVGSSTIPVQCSDQAQCVALYSLMYRLADRMGSPTSMVSPDSIISKTKQTGPDAAEVSDAIGQVASSTMESSTVLDGYTFGSVNILKFESISCSGSEVVRRFKYVYSSNR